MRRVEFEAADRAWHASRDRYRVTPREAYVLRSAPIRGLSQRRRGHAALGRIWTIWLVHDEDLSPVVDGLSQRGFLARRGGAGPAYAELTAEGRAAMQAYEAEVYTAGGRGTPFGHRHHARAKGSGDHSARPAAETPEEHRCCGGANRYAGRQTASHDSTAGPGRRWRS
jgi:hypothetical protein